jgi:hypothetical protein
MTPIDALLLIPGQPRHAEYLRARLQRFLRLSGEGAAGLLSKPPGLLEVLHMTIGTSFVGRPPNPDEGGKSGPLAAWPERSDAAIATAIDRWSLNRVGWRGFDALPWVKSLKEKYPEVERIASTCSGAQGEHVAASRKLIAGAEADDRAAIRSYFVGKLALEELSCRLSGAGAGLCDKRSAFMRIFEVMGEETRG